MDKRKFVPPAVRAADSYDTDEASLASGFCTVGDSLTKQEFSEESDINYIVKQFGLTGQLPSNVAVPMDGDFIDSLDYQSALNAVIAAQDAFAAMPADVRVRFNHDPGAFLAFVHDPANRDEALKLGLLVPPKAPDPVDPAPPAQSST